ncbi:MAG: hypothetical protein K2L64_00900, partial [Ureaplasma sp.]|nr:hypothetical protein [Ureaplasma sp.]
NKIIYDENGKNWKFVYENNDGYTDNYVSPSLKNRSNDVNGLDHYKINAITDVYNRILRNNRNNDINDIVSPEEIIFLYNEFPGKKLSPIDLKYREFVSNGTNQALSIYHDQDVKLFDNQKDLDYFIQNNTALKPGEVNIFISEDGIPMNPGIKLTDDKKWIPTSDAIYDTKENIFDNLNRTFIVPVSDEYVYYIEDNGKHTLISNQLNNLYRLRIKRKASTNNYDKDKPTNDKDLIIDSYFNSYEACWKALNNYIVTKTKVAKIIKKDNYV